MNKIILTLSIIVTFVASSIMIGTMVDAVEQPNVQPFKTIWEAIAGLQETDESLQDQIDELSTTGATYISEDFSCTQTVPPIYVCTNYCDEGDQAVNVYPNDETEMTNLQNGYRWVVLVEEPITFKILCIDWQE